MYIKLAFKQEGISVECQLPASRQCVLHSKQVWMCAGGGRALDREEAGTLCRAPHPEQTDPTEHITFLQLCWWAVIAR